jgi:hypothetical protein
MRSRKQSKRDTCVPVPRSPKFLLTEEARRGCAPGGRAEQNRAKRDTCVPVPRSPKFLRKRRGCAPGGSAEQKKRDTNRRRRTAATGGAQSGLQKKNELVHARDEAILSGCLSPILFSRPVVETRSSSQGGTLDEAWGRGESLCHQLRERPSQKKNFQKKNRPKKNLQKSALFALFALFL